MFRTGQKVVCICDDFNTDKAGVVVGILPVEGEVYTVRAVTNVQYVCLRLVEIVNPRMGDREAAFDAAAFRPVTDISVFTDMLVKAPKMSDPLAAYR